MAGYHPLKAMQTNGNTMREGNSAGGDGGDHYKQEMILAVETGNEEKLVESLKHLGPKEVNHVFPHPHSGTALHVATNDCSSNLVTVLLKAGADPNISDEKGNKNYYPIHYAAKNGNTNILRSLLQHEANPNVKEGEFQRTALHLLAMNWTQAKEETFKDFLNILLDYKKIKVDTQDSHGASPLFLAAKKKWEYMVKALIYKGANTESGVGNKTAGDLIKKTFPGLMDDIDLEKIEKPKRYFGEELNDALKAKDMDTFKMTFKDLENSDESKTMASIIGEKHGTQTMLEYACDNGMTEFVEELLKHGANAGGEKSTMTPILYAARNGYHIIMGKLILAMEKQGLLLRGALKQCDKLKETALHKVVKRAYLEDKEEVDYYKCLNLLLEKRSYVDIDAKDEFNNTPLHYAVLSDDQSFVRTLLLHGANLGIRNNFGTLAITRIKATILEEVLNDCIKHKNNVADRNFEIILHYRILAPAKALQQPETECLRFISHSRKHRHLLLHPVIDTFLFLKWQKVRPYYFFNVCAYILFLLLLTAYILLYHGTYVDPSSPPVSDKTSGLNNTISNGVDGISIDVMKEALQENLAVKYILKGLISLLTLYIAVREGVQFFVSIKLYFSRLENWIESSIVILTVFLLFIPIPAASLQSLSAWLILLSWMELILLLGGHPALSVYVTMFTTVTYNFFIFILMFSLMIIAFSISFFLVFQSNEHFESYQLSLLKTIAMTTGEIEYTDLPLSDFPFSSHLLFVLFVFLIVLVLMNLLVGLAVSDIQQIQQEAQVVSYSSRVELISYIESVFLAAPFQSILPGLTCCSQGSEEDSYLTSCNESRNPIIRILNWMGRKTLMFNVCLQDDPCITMYPNKEKKSDRWHVCTCHSFHLREAQIEAAKDVLLEKEQSDSSHRLSNLEERLDQVMSAISNLTEQVNRHVLCPSPQ